VLFPTREFDQVINEDGTFPLCCATNARQSASAPAPAGYNQALPYRENRTKRALASAAHQETCLNSRYFLKHPAPGSAAASILTQEYVGVLVSLQGMARPCSDSDRVSSLNDAGLCAPTSYLFSLRRIAVLLSQRLKTLLNSWWLKGKGFLATTKLFRTVRTAATL